MWSFLHFINYSRDLRRTHWFCWLVGGHAKLLWEVKVIGVSVTSCSIFLISLLYFCLEIPLMICENRSGGLKLGKGRELKVGRSKCNFLNNDAITLTGTKDRAEN